MKRTNPFHWLSKSSWIMVGRLTSTINNPCSIFDVPLPFGHMGLHGEHGEPQRALVIHLTSTINNPCSKFDVPTLVRYSMFPGLMFNDLHRYLVFSLDDFNQV